MNRHDELDMHEGRHLDDMLQPSQYVKKKTLQKYKIICAVSRHCSSGLLLFFFPFRTVETLQFSNLQAFYYFCCINVMIQGSLVIDA